MPRKAQNRLRTGFNKKEKHRRALVGIKEIEKDKLW